MKDNMNAAAFCALFSSVLLCACATTQGMTSEEAVATEEPAPVQAEAAETQNPPASYDGIEAAERSAGFQLLAPEEISSIYAAGTYRAIRGKMIEVVYPNSSSPGDEIRIRKSSEGGDASGEYSPYAETEALIINGNVVEARKSAGLTHVALWSDGGFSYAVTSTKGISLGMLKDIVEQVQ